MPKNVKPKTYLGGVCSGRRKRGCVSTRPLPHSWARNEHGIAVHCRRCGHKATASVRNFLLSGTTRAKGCHQSRRRPKVEVISTRPYTGPAPGQGRGTRQYNEARVRVDGMIRVELYVWGNYHGGAWRRLSSRTISDD